MHLWGGAIVLLSAGLGLPSTWQIMLGVAVMLSGATLFVAWPQCQHLDIFDPHSYWRAVPTVLVLLAVAGLPLTVGFPGRVALYWSTYTAGRWVLLLLVAVAETLFLGALLRVLLEIECVLEMDAEDGMDDAGTGEATGPAWWRATLAWVRRVDWQREVGYAAGAALAGCVLVLGIALRALEVPPLGAWFALPTLPVWAAWLLPVIGAVVLYRSRDRLLDVAVDWWPLVQRVTTLDWLYQGVERVLYHLSTLIWGGTQVVEGAGHIAWVVLACLVILLFIISR
jgi:hypothetical protein